MRSLNYIVPGKKNQQEVWMGILNDIEIRGADQSSTLLRINFRKLSAIAASLIITLVVSSLLLMNNVGSFVRIHNAEKKQIILPDESLVEVNSGSRVHYANRSWARNRSVRLKGEAFFSVKKGSDFVVSTPSGKVRVLGTQFNVKARPGIFEVKCFSGRVRVETKQDTVILTPGQIVSFTQDEVINSHFAIHGDMKPAWIAGEFYYREALLSQVLEELERQFDLEIQGYTPESRLYSGYFNNHDLQTALHMVLDPMGLEFKIKKTGLVFINQ